MARELPRSELLHTSSAKSGEAWAGEKRSGFISYRVTETPRCAACQAASQPASPAPTTTSSQSLSTDDEE